MIEIRTNRPEIDGLPQRVAEFLQRNILDIIIDDMEIRGYRAPDARSIWIRDYSDMLRIIKYLDSDVQSVINHFAGTQAANGRLFDYFTTHPEKLPCERENWTKYVRVPVEADVEYRFIKAVALAYQATEDRDVWLKELMGPMERALSYIMHHPWRWDKTHQLVKRPYTIDTWDFAYTAGQHDWLQFQIDKNTYWGVFHGDNSGYYEAFRLLARFCQILGREEAGTQWEERAKTLQKNLNRVCWNGRFYTHFVKLTPVTIPGVNEAEQLSLSNPMAVNRGAATPDMAASIIEEYRKRYLKKTHFAEWFSIDPPFPDGIFGDEKLTRGAYVNGGIMPLVGGELAMASLRNGFEAYGADIISRYARMVADSGASYLWYFPDGSPSTVETSTSPEAPPADGWGSSAMLWALIEGLAGVEDHKRGFRQVALSPRWPAAGIHEAAVHVTYPASGAGLEYVYRCGTGRMVLSVNSPSAQEIQVAALMPEGRAGAHVKVNGNEIRFDQTRLRNSLYVKCLIPFTKSADIEIQLKAR